MVVCFTAIHVHLCMNLMLGLSFLRGPPGRDGRDGKDGKDGKDGADGKDGRDGEDGKDGRDGRDLELIHALQIESKQI